MTLSQWLDSQDLPADLADISPELLAVALLCHSEKLWPSQIEYLESFLAAPEEKSVKPIDSTDSES